MVALICPMIIASSFQGQTPEELNEENQERDKGEKQRLPILQAKPSPWLAEILKIRTRSFGYLNTIFQKLKVVATITIT